MRVVAEQRQGLSASGAVSARTCAAVAPWACRPAIGCICMIFNVCVSVGGWVCCPCVTPGYANVGQRRWWGGVGQGP